MPSKTVKPVAIAAMSSLLCGVPLVAHAQKVILPDYTASQHVVARAQGQTPDSSTITSFGLISDAKSSPAGVVGVGKGTVSGSLSGFPMPVMSAVAHADLDGMTVPPNSPTAFISSTGAYNGELKYYFEVLGPGPTADLHITTLGKLSVAATSSGAGFSSDLNLEIDQLGRGANIPSFGLIEHSAAFGADGGLLSATSDVTGALSTGLSGGFMADKVYTLSTNTVFSVDMTVDVAAAVDGRGGTADAYGYIDPLFTIASSTPNAGAYSLVFSDGIGDSPLAGGVPEPSAWATMLLGFGLLGAMGRRRRAILT